MPANVVKSDDLQIYTILCFPRLCKGFLHSWKENRFFPKSF